jgi:hypothetical protein
LEGESRRFDQAKRGSMHAGVLLEQTPNASLPMTTHGARFVWATLASNSHQARPAIGRPVALAPGSLLKQTHHHRPVRRLATPSTNTRWIAFTLVRPPVLDRSGAPLQLQYRRGLLEQTLSQIFRVSHVVTKVFSRKWSGLHEHGTMSMAIIAIRCRSRLALLKQTYDEADQRGPRKVHHRPARFVQTKMLGA